MADFGPSQPTTKGEKANVSREAMGGEAVKGMHSMHISAADNGHIIEHRSKKVKAKDEYDTADKKIIVPVDHPMHKHIQALHEHCMDCPD